MLSIFGPDVQGLGHKLKFEEEKKNKSCDLEHNSDSLERNVHFLHKKMFPLKKVQRRYLAKSLPEAPFPVMT